MSKGRKMYRESFLGPKPYRCRTPLQTDRETSMKVLAKTLALSDKQLLERTYDGAIAEHKLPAKQERKGKDD